jgi:FkbM family methyltransferase
MIVRTLHGFDMRIDPLHDRGVERSIYFSGSYEKGTLFILSKLLRPGDTFVDVGANIGLMTIHAARIVGSQGRVIAFEPNSTTRDMLEFNIALNGLTNVEVIPCAVGARNEHAKIYDDPGANRGRSSLIRPDGVMTGMDTQVVRLDDALIKYGKVHLVKMDIEGYELEALIGMGSMLSTTERPMLMVECSGDRENSHGRGTKAIFDHMDSVGGYRYFRPRKGKERPSRMVELKGYKEFPEHDNVFCLAHEHFALLKDAHVIAR